jgi:hypothetical protein
MSSVTSLAMFIWVLVAAVARVCTTRWREGTFCVRARAWRCQLAVQGAAQFHHAQRSDLACPSLPPKILFGDPAALSPFAHVGEPTNPCLAG